MNLVMGGLPGEYLRVLLMKVPEGLSYQKAILRKERAGLGE